MRKEIELCQSTVYLMEGEQDEMVMRKATRRVPVEGGVQLETFFEEPCFVPGRVSQVDYLRHTVSLIMVFASVGTVLAWAVAWKGRG